MNHLHVSIQHPRGTLGSKRRGEKASGLQRAEVRCPMAPAPAPGSFSVGSPQFLSLRLTPELPPYPGLLLGACQVAEAMEVARWSGSKHPYSCCEGHYRGVCAKVNPSPFGQELCWAVFLDLLSFSLFWASPSLPVPTPGLLPSLWLLRSTGITPGRLPAPQETNSALGPDGAFLKCFCRHLFFTQPRTFPPAWPWG